jgi:hypothetical protein
LIEVVSSISLGRNVTLVTNGNAWALMVLPLIAVAGGVHLQPPRSKWLFYAFYSAHLAILLLVNETT